MAFESLTLDADSHGAARLRAGALAALLICGPLFIIFPEIDTRISRLFFTPGVGFSGKHVNVEALRDVFKLMYVAACAAAVAGIIYTRASGYARFMRFTGIQHVFFIACLAIGPGLMTNVIFKDHWGRARPREIVEFGGSKAFTPALLPARQCQTNCSFVSGEASSIFMIFFAGALLLPGWAVVLTISGIAAGMAAGGIRVAQGGHFLSDVVFAGVLMAFTAVMIHQAFKAIAPEFSASAEELR